MKPIKILFILFSLFTIHYSLLARDALPVLVEGGEPLKENLNSFYIDNQILANTVVISPNGETIVSGSMDGSIRVWDIKTGKLLKIFQGHKKWINTVAISQNGEMIVSASSDKTIKVWNFKTGKLIKTLQVYSNIISVAISPNGKKIVSASYDHQDINIWDIKTGKRFKVLQGHKKAVTSIAISSNGEMIVSSSEDKTIKVWNMETGELLKTLQGHQDTVISVAISSNGKRIASGSRDKTIKIWSIQTGKLLKTLQGHQKIVISVAISSNGKRIASGSGDKTIKIWDIETGKLIRTLEGHKYGINSLAIDSKEKTIVSCSDDKSIKVWNIKTGKLIKTLQGHKSGINSVFISSNGERILSAGETIQIWNTKTKKMSKILQGHEEFITSIAISPDEERLVSGSGDETIKIWDRKTGKLLRTLQGHKGVVTSIAISPNGKKIVSGSGLFLIGRDTSIKVWDIETGELLKTLNDDKNKHNKIVSSVVISPNGETIIAGLGGSSELGTIKIWDIKTGKLLKTFYGHKKGVTSVAIHSNGKTIISGSRDKSIKIWDIETGKLLRTLYGHKDDVESVAISPNGEMIVSGSNDSTIKVWNMKTGKLLKTLHGHKKTVTSVAISPNGETIISGPYDSTIKVWSIKTGKLLREYIGGVDGNWLVRDFKTKKLYRGDNGTFLLQKKEIYRDKNISSYALTSTLPQNYNLSRTDKLKLSMLNKNIIINNDNSMELNLSIEDLGDTSYFLDIQGAGEYLIMQQKRVSKIKKGETQNVPLKIYAKLSQKNPKPIQTELNMTVLTGNGTEFNLTFPISICYANIKVTKAEVSEDGENLNIEVKNIGNEPLIKADVNLSKPFQADIQTLTNLEPNATKVLAFSIPIKPWGELPEEIDVRNGIPRIVIDKNATLTIDISIPNEESKNAMPLYEWRSEGVKILTSSMWRIYVLLAWIVVVGTVVLWYYKRYKNPLVKKLENPKELLTLNIEQLKEAKTRLSKIDRFKNILAENHITQERYEKAEIFNELDPKVKANYFAKRTFAKTTKLDEQSYMLTLNDDFPLNVKQFILFISNKESIADMMSEIKQIPQYSKNILFILSDNAELQAKIATEKGYEKFVRVQPQTITKLLLAEDGAKVLADSFAKQLALTQISPYNLGGGESNSSMFFGRREIISHVVGRGNNNYIVIGSRQIGKSSLMKAIEREYVKNQERVHYISVGKGNFVRAMGRALGIKVTNLEELVAYISVQKEKVLFLLDEVDPFIKDEKESGYKVLDSFRKLSEEGSCNFILAGYWELYFYTMFDNQSPLKNFGEAIELGALEAEACQEMITEPMQQLGLRFESDEAINEIVERTGQRPNLIAIICNNIIKSLGKEKRVVSMAEVQEAIKGKKVYELFESWKKLDEDEEASKLDKIIVYSMVEQGSFRLAELVERLKVLGLNVEMSRLETSLARLKVSYTIERNEEGVYGFMLPLFREYVLRDDYEVKLAGEVEGYL